MKVRSAIKKICKDCYIVQRGKTRYVYCKENARHKQRQGFHSWILHDKMTCECCEPSLTSLTLSMDAMNLSNTTNRITYDPSIGINSVLFPKYS